MTSEEAREGVIFFSRQVLERDLAALSVAHRQALGVALRDLLRGGEVGVPIADVAGVQVLTLGLAGPEEMEKVRVLYAAGEQGIRVLAAGEVGDGAQWQAAAERLAEEQKAARDAGRDAWVESGVETQPLARVEGAAVVAAHREDQVTAQAAPPDQHVGESVVVRPGRGDG